VKAASYGLIIATLGGLALWGYWKHRATPGRVPVEVPPREELPAAAGMDRRLATASAAELLAPAAFPWSLAGVSRLPRAEVAAVTITRAPEGTAAPEELRGRLAAALAEQAPTIARPFTLATSPPYLITPLTLELEFFLDETGAAAAAGVAGAPADLNASFAERAVRFVFPPAAGSAAFAATVTLVPSSYDRLRARRRGQPVPEEEYRLLFRALQYNSFPLYDTCLVAAPELLTAEEGTVVTFEVDAEGQPQRVTFDPPPASAEAAEALAATLAEIHLPRAVAGATVEFTLGG